ncbi:MAG: hypothetical protein KAS32_09465 [Candidatus Peribacteraceae bacterium]|nr:hypothetical protein [Candidatus Peribacteraceae bacterium]
MGLFNSIGYSWKEEISEKVEAEILQNKNKRDIDHKRINKDLNIPTKPVATVEEIHKAFHTEVDRLLAEASIVVDEPVVNQKKIDDYTTLDKLGFRQSSTLHDNREEFEKKAVHKDIEEQKTLLRETINYFSQNYSNYKFITEESVKLLCKKFSLVYGNIAIYTGSIPSKNIEDMKNFMVHQKDVSYFGTSDYDPLDYDEYRSRIKNLSKVPMSIYLNKIGILENVYEDYETKSFSGKSIYYGKHPWQIVAPLSDMDMKDKEVRNFQVVGRPPEDPIVLQPVLYKGDKHYLIVTAWGPEALDPLVMNPKHN